MTHSLIYNMVKGDKLNQSEKVSTFLLSIGVAVACWDGPKLLGIILAWATNLSQTLQTMYTKQLNSGNKVKPFGKSKTSITLV